MRFKNEARLHIVSMSIAIPKTNSIALAAMNEFIGEATGNAW